MADTLEVRVPDIGGFDSVEVIEVLVKPGDSVALEQSLITLESDKASMEIPAPAAGVVASMNIKLGDKVSMGDVILLLQADGEQAKNNPAAATTETPAVAAPAQPTPTATPAVATAAAPAAQQAASPSNNTRPSPTAHIDDSQFRQAHASPAVRKFARELGADLSLIRGSGPKQRITKDDVTAFVKNALSGSAAAYGGSTVGGKSSGSGIPAMPSVDFSKWGEIEIKELSRIKKLSGANLHRNWLNVPHVTHHDETDITELEAFRESLKAAAEKRGLRVTALTFIIKAVASALRQFPQFNSSLSADNQSLIYKKYCHVGIAVDTPNGLVVPVFRDVDQKSIFQLAEEMAEVSARARNGKLKPDEMQGGCFSISSLGGIGGTAFTPIVNAPEVAILGVTRARMQPVWNGKEFIPRLMLPLDLSYDHRVVDGAEAARFMAFLCQTLSDIRQLLL